MTERRSTSATQRNAPNDQASVRAGMQWRTRARGNGRDKRRAKHKIIEESSLFSLKMRVTRHCSANDQHCSSKQQDRCKAATDVAFPIPGQGTVWCAERGWFVESIKSIVLFALGRRTNTSRQQFLKKRLVSIQ